MKKRYGEFDHVQLSNEEYQKLCETYGKGLTDEYIRAVDEYCELKGVKYKNYNLAVRNFLRRDNKKPIQEQASHNSDEYDLSSIFEGRAMNGFEQSIMALANNTQPNKAVGDYIKDGLLYCGKCHTAKQVEISLSGKVIRPYCMCKCEEAQERQKQSQFILQQRREEIERNRREGFLDIDMMNYRFENDDRKNAKISDIARRYVDNFDKMRSKGKGLMFIGNSGTGKSFMAACIANALIDKGIKCLITNFPRIINELSGMYEGKQEYIDDLRKYSLIVIDDLAIERDTDYTAEIVQNVVDSRYRSGLPLIITTNLTKTEFESPQNVRKERLFSRLYEMCLPLAMAGQDRRKANAAMRDEDIKKILGV